MASFAKRAVFDRSGARALASVALLLAAVPAVAAEPARLVGEKFCVAPRERLDMTFTARVAKGASIETRPLYSNLMTVAACNVSLFPKGNRFSRVGARFFGADGKALKETWLCQSPVLIWSSEPRRYRFSCFAPEGAERMQLRLLCGEKENDVEVNDIRLVRSDPFSAPIRNINPNLDFGLFNSSGYSFMGSARWRVAPDGANWFDLLQGSCYPDAFPVRGGEELEVRFHGASPTWLRFYVCFYSSWDDVGDVKKNKKSFILDVHNESHSPERVESFDVPPDAKWARIYFQPSGEIRDLRIVGRQKEGR